MNIYQKYNWLSSDVQAQIEPLPIALINAVLKGGGIKQNH